MRRALIRCPTLGRVKTGKEHVFKFYGNPPLQMVLVECDYKDRATARQEPVKGTRI